MMNRNDFRIMDLLSNNLAPYEAVTWLATPHKKLEGRTPYDMIKKNRGTRVYAVCYDDMKILQAKKKKRSRK